MSIKDIFLKPVELREIYIKSLEGVIDINDLTGTQRAQLLQYAENERNNAISFIHDLLLVNPEITFEFLAKSNTKYIESERVINWLKEQAVKSNETHFPKTSPETEKSNVSIEKLEKCVYLLSYWTHSNDMVIDTLLNNGINFDKDYIEPLEKELKNNLIFKDTFEAKRDLIRHYIFEFIELYSFFKFHEYVLFNNLSETKVLNYANEVENDFNKYVILCLEYYQKIFDILQLYCLKYNIDFFELCNEINFPLEYVDSSHTIFFLEKNSKDFNHQPKETKTETEQETKQETKQETIELKPKFRSEAVNIVFETIKDFFNHEQQDELKHIIETGDKASKKLLFKSNGNKLTDTFKKLIEHSFIVGCQKQDLINWVISNFTFTHQNKVKPFIYDTVEKIISRNDNPCKNPLIEIKNGQIQKVENPKIRKQNKY